MIDESEIVFSPWHPWNESLRRPLRKGELPYSPDLEWPGIYVWAQFLTQPDASLQIEHPPQGILYIGESKKPLKKRIHQFAKSCSLGSSGHAGGRRTQTVLAQDPGDLYLCYFSLNLINEPHDFWQDVCHWSRPFLHYVERKLVWQYVRLWGQRPQCNNT